jgi:hypothetical protein
MNILRSAPLGATRGGFVSQDHCTSYLTDKCSVQNRDVTGGKAVYARAVIEPGELIAVWSGRIVGADELDVLEPEIRRHTVQVEEGLYLASLSPDEPPDFINHSCEPNAGLDGQVAIVAMQRIQPGEEITIDYAMCDGSAYDEFDCECGSASAAGACRATTGAIPLYGSAMPGISRPICNAASTSSSSRCGDASDASAGLWRL